MPSRRWSLPRPRSSCSIVAIFAIVVARHPLVACLIATAAVVAGLVGAWSNVAVITGPRRGALIPQDRRLRNWRRLAWSSGGGSASGGRPPGANAAARLLGRVHRVVGALAEVGLEVALAGHDEGDADRRPDLLQAVARDVGRRDRRARGRARRGRSRSPRPGRPTNSSMNSSPPRRPAASVTRIERRSRSPSAASTSSPDVVRPRPVVDLLEPVEVEEHVRRALDARCGRGAPPRRRGRERLCRSGARSARPGLARPRPRSSATARGRATAHSAGAHQPTATQVTTNTQPSTVSATSVPRNDRSKTWSVSRSVRPSRRTTTPAASPVGDDAEHERRDDGPDEHQPRSVRDPERRGAGGRQRGERARPPIAASARPAWFASAPYHGTSRQLAALERREERDPAAGDRAAEHHRGDDEREVEGEDAVPRWAAKDPDRAREAEQRPEQDAGGPCPRRRDPGTAIGPASVPNA